MIQSDYWKHQTPFFLLKLTRSCAYYICSWKLICAFFIGYFVVLVAIPTLTLMSMGKCKSTHSFALVSHLSPQAKVKHVTQNLGNLIG